MATVKQGHLTTSKEWAKHLRPIGKRLFWASERAAEPRAIAEMAGDTVPTCESCTAILGPTASEPHAPEDARYCLACASYWSDVEKGVFD